jgi:hypothetical protein
MNDLKLGESEIFEVWFLPTDRENYSVCLLQAYETPMRAQEYCAAMTMSGTMEIVRVRTIRQLMMSVVP